MDPLSDILSLLKPRSYACGGLDAGSDASISFPAHDGIKCYAVVNGEAWLAVDGIVDPVLLTAGDCLVLPHGRPFRLATDLDLPSVYYHMLFADRSPGMVSSFNGGGGCMLVGGYFALDGKHADILLGVLPPIVHIRSEADKASLRWSLDQMMQELKAPQPGSRLIVEQLAQMMLVRALRLHMADVRHSSVGWLFALADAQIGPAIEAMHDDPGCRWTLQRLAKRVGMSRSAFSHKFRNRVGSTPMEYLTRWRMMLAGDRLVKSDSSIADIALAHGYESESSFSTAFKREMGCTPRRYGSEKTYAAA